MSYMKDKNKGGGQFVSAEIGLSTVSSNPSRGTGAPQYAFYELEPAEVVDIILDDTHPEFNDFRDIGKVKVRLVISERDKDLDALSYAKPMDPNIKSYPLITEVVIIVDYLGERYWTQRMNVFNNLNENSYPDVSTSTFRREEDSSAKASEYETISSTGNPNQQEDVREASLGQVFEKQDIKPLRPFEGDVIIEGRFGHSLRFSSNQETGQPNFKLKIGQPPDLPEAKIAIIEENINDDPNSLWITTDETVPFLPATANASVHLQFYNDKPSEFGGNQIFMNSDRIVLNSKVNETMIFSKKAINLVSEGVVTIDSVNDIWTNTTTKTVFNSPEIYLGAEDADESVVLGNTMIDWLQRLIDAINLMTHPTGTGPSGPPINAAAFTSLAQELENLLSVRNFTK